MSTSKKQKTSKPTSRPATTPEARERQLIALATDLAEEQLRNGKASSQVISHFLKLGSTKEMLEREIRQEEKKMIKAKTEQLESAKDVKELYGKALKAMSIYSGKEVQEDEEDL